MGCHREDCERGSVPPYSLVPYGHRYAVEWGSGFPGSGEIDGIHRQRRTALWWSLIAPWVLYGRAAAGINEIHLMRLTGHSDFKMLREHIAEATLYDTNTSALLGLETILNIDEGLDMLQKITTIVLGVVAGTFALAFELVLSLYTAFVLMNLWDWFVAPTFNLSPISFWMMFGLTLVFRVFRNLGSGAESGKLRRLQKIEAMVDACVPDAQREGLKEKFKKIEGPVWVQIMAPFDSLLGETFVLGVGFAVHKLAS